MVGNCLLPVFCTAFRAVQGGGLFVRCQQVYGDSYALAALRADHDRGLWGAAGLAERSARYQYAAGKAVHLSFTDRLGDRSCSRLKCGCGERRVHRTAHAAGRHCQFAVGAPRCQHRPRP